MAPSTTTITCFLLHSLLAFSVVAAERPPVVSGLSWNHYRSSCPHVESIVRRHLRDLFETNIGLAAGLLRLHFHDCFVKGCDASVLLEGPGDEEEAPPNRSLSKEGIQTIEDLRGLVHKECGQVVSCADITALAARDSVYLSGGPYYEIPLGRRDSLSFPTVAETTANLPSPFSNATTLLSEFSNKGFDATDLVALSGAHTIGRSNCRAFTGRLYPTRDPTLDAALAAELEAICPTANTNATTVLDIRTPNQFDNEYYVNLVSQQGLFTSDEDLYMDPTTKEIVVEFASDRSRFFDKFVAAMVKMGQLSVLTGVEGEVRGNCSAVNAASEHLASVVGDDQHAPEKEQFTWY